jgi:translation initiation factor 2A
MSESELPPSPPCHLLARSKTGIELFAVPSQPDESVPPGRTLVEGSTAFLKTAPDGSCAYAQLSGVGVIRIELDNDNSQDAVVKKGNAKAFLENSTTIQVLEISPKGSYLLTWERPTESQPNNLKVWDASTGTCLMSLPQKALKREGWPYLQWTPDEQFAFLLVTSELRVYTPESIRTDQRFVEKLRIPGITSLSVPSQSTKTNYYFTTFASGTKDQPARVSLYQYLPGKAGTGPYPPLLSKSLFQAEEMKTHWNPQGDIALITVQTSVDTSGQSYYGSSQSLLLGAHCKDVQAVPLPQEGPVHAVAWMPEADKPPPCFAIVAGKMPAMTSLHHGLTGKPTFLLGNAHRNTIAWAPHGRFVCVAGFGNLAGGLSFWDRYKEKLIPGVTANVQGTLRADAVVGYGWAPDSRVFVVSTCSPRMNVDNGMRLFKYNGQELLNVPWDNARYRPDQLLEACFVPAPTTYPDRPQSPLPTGAANPSSTPSATAAPAAPPATRYIPPSARNRTGGGSLAERMRQERQATMQTSGKVVADKTPAQKVFSIQPQLAKNAMTGKVIPGLVAAPAAATTTKSKSAAKREKLKAKQQSQDEADRKAQEVARVLQEQQQQEAEQTKEAETTTTQSEPVDPEKRARKIKKTLKQIDDLKANDPSMLNDEQKAKIATESELREELAQLGL